MGIVALVNKTCRRTMWTQAKYLKIRHTLSLKLSEVHTGHTFVMRTAI